MVRFSLASLMLILVYASISCAALVHATGIWPQVAVTMTVVVLLLFTLGAVFWQGAARVFAVGASITGGIYFLLVFTSVLNVREFLLTETAVRYLFNTIHSSPATANPTTVQSVQNTAFGPVVAQRVVYMAPATPAPPLPATPQRPIVAAAPPPPRALPSYYSATFAAGVQPAMFGSIGHSIWSVILACCGGLLAQVIARRRGQGVRSNEMTH